MYVMDNPDIDTPATETAKLRRCLKCRSEFSSAWEGHRMCDRCKHTSAWREGMPAQSYGLHGH